MMPYALSAGTSLALKPPVGKKLTVPGGYSAEVGSTRELLPKDRLYGNAHPRMTVGKAEKGSRR